MVQGLAPGVCDGVADELERVQVRKARGRGQRLGAAIGDLVVGQAQVAQARERRVVGERSGCVIVEPGVAKIERVERGQGVGRGEGARALCPSCAIEVRPPLSAHALHSDIIALEKVL